VHFELPTGPVAGRVHLSDDARLHAVPRRADADGHAVAGCKPVDALCRHFHNGLQSVDALHDEQGTARSGNPPVSARFSTTEPPIGASIVA